MTSRSMLGRGGLIVLLTLIGCTPDSRDWADLNEDGAFLMYRRQSLIGEETFSITSDQDSIVVRSLQGENERGRITGVQAELRLGIDLSPALYVNQRIADSDTTNILEVAFESDVVTIREKAMEVVTASSAAGFPLHSNIPAAMEMMLYHYYLDRGLGSLPTLPRGEVRITRRGQDVVDIDGTPTTLDRYVVEGINWGLRTIWLNDSNDLVALVQANTQFREAIRKGYEEALPFFIEGNVEEQMRTLADYTESLQGEQSEVTALVGGDVVDALSDVTRRDMTVIVAKGRIREIGSISEVVIPSDARVIDVSGKTLIPGLWDMHAHSNQVQWAPAYLAGGITTIRDLGNELEFATAFRDAVANDGAMGPDILLAGMVDGAGVTGNGVIRATTTDEARSVVARYFDEGYKQIKIYTAVEPEVLSVLTEEAHARGMTVSGHVPRAVGNAVEAVARGMDQFNHRELFLSVLFPDEEVVDLGGLYLFDRELTRGQIRRATSFFLEHRIVLDPTISLDIIRNLPRGTPVETVEPDVTRIAYELWEGKRFLPGVSPLRAAQMTEDVKRAMEIIGTFHRAGVPIVAGTDNVVPVFSLYREMEAYHDLGGLTPLDALRTATIIPARAMGMASKTGTLEVGKEADIAILDRNPLDDFVNIRSVSAVMTNGRYYQSALLWRAADFEPGRN
ncbi:MAG: amidohydrolase family protein [Longimicrobiales bacterium]|nr:amidohydrolase family protein [Longimicrobiales bacterium]